MFGINDRWITIDELEVINEQGRRDGQLSYDQILCSPATVHFLADAMTKRGWRKGTLTPKRKAESIASPQKSEVPILCSEEMPLGIAAFFKGDKVAFSINLLRGEGADQTVINRDDVRRVLARAAQPSDDEVREDIEEQISELDDVTDGALVILRVTPGATSEQFDRIAKEFAELGDVNSSDQSSRRETVQ